MLLLIIVHIAQSSGSDLTPFDEKNPRYAKISNGRFDVLSKGSFSVYLLGFKSCIPASNGFPMGFIDGAQVSWQFTNKKRISIPKSMQNKDGPVRLSICGFDFVIPRELVEYTVDKSAHLKIDPTL